MADAPASPEAPARDAARTDTEQRLRDLEARLKQLAAAIEELRREGTGSSSSKIAELEKQIEALTREIERLRMGEAAAPSADRSEHGLGPAASKVYRVQGGVSLGGYGEMIYRDFSRGDDSGAPSGADDRLDLLRAVFYFGYKWSDRILFNSEIEFEHATTGEGDEEKGEVSVEFAYLDFLVKKGFNVRGGLLLIPVGILNEMHEPTTFAGVLRPGVESLILPTTWRENGAGVFGETGWLAYRVYLVAGLDAAGFSGEEGLREGRQGGSASLANSFAWTGRLDVTRVPGLVAGVAAYRGDSDQGQMAADATVETLDLHAQYAWRGFEGRVLWARVEVDDTAEINQLLGFLPLSGDSIGQRMKGWYVQAAWDILSLREGSQHQLAP
ncbi:MAG TPA: hypothetical protein VGR38_06685, partial [Candidatus Polarisedimenticolia bacterium]|nr:hypothetical protein [Candidatus Polarisedimenticolia bacterium]